MLRQRFINPFVYLVVTLGATAFLWSVWQMPIARLDARFWLLALFTVACSSRLIVRIPRIKGDITVSDTFIFLTLLLYGGEAAVLVATAEGMASARRVSKTVNTFLFNTTMMAFSTFLTASALRISFGAGRAPAQMEFSTSFVLALSLMAFVQYISNSGLAAVRHALKTGAPIFQTWTNSFLWTSITYFAGASAAGIITRLTGRFGFHALLVTLPIIAVVYFTYRVYLRNVEMSEEKAAEAQRHVEELSRHIAEQERISKALKESEEHFRSAFDQAAGMALVDLDGRWLQVNQSLCRMLGFTEEELLGNNFKAITRPEDLGGDLNNLYQLVEGRATTTQIEKRYLHQSGADVWVLQSASLVRDTEGSPQHFIFQIQDITERKQAEEHIHHAAFHDALTNLPNRILLTDRLSVAVERAKRNPDYQFAVLFIDLDRFKIVNDSLGHQYGDQLLIEVAGRLRTSVRAVDTVARLGGDEFAILLDGIEGVENAAPTAERIQEQLTSPFTLFGQEVFISGSIGIAFSRSGYNSPDDILRDSDAAMYRAKSNGKARHEIFDQTMHARAMEQLQLENDLRRAVERHEIEVHYQPIVSLASTEIRGFEALARWPHPQRGYVSPVEFIRIAEETGLIIVLGLEVLREACRQTAAWQARFPLNSSLTISVNLSPRQLKQPDLVEQVEAVLQDTGLRPECLRMEITESLVMENPDTAARILDRLKQLGVQLSLDDFGTGYSSLSYLHRFPFDILKIDRSFVSRNDQGSVKIIKTILMLAAELNLTVVAEGIETEQQLEQLRTLNCAYGQGYFFSRPLSREAAENLFTSDESTHLKAPLLKNSQADEVRAVTSSWQM